MTAPIQPPAIGHLVERSAFGVQLLPGLKSSLLLVLDVETRDRELSLVGGRPPSTRQIYKITLQNTDNKVIFSFWATADEFYSNYTIVCVSGGPGPPVQIENHTCQLPVADETHVLSDGIRGP